MKFLLDMNLPPSWIEALAQSGIEAQHWKDLGRPDAEDSELMAWAREHGFVVFTHDLDFGALLYATAASAPSVVQLRCEDIRPKSCASWVIPALLKAEDQIAKGALLSLDPRKSRIRILPLFPSTP